MPDAKKRPVPSAVKSPIAVLAEPTLPPRVMTPEPAVRVRLLPATEASTLPVMVIAPAPEVVMAAKVKLFKSKFPVTSA